MEVQHYFSSKSIFPKDVPMSKEPIDVKEMMDELIHPNAQFDNKVRSVPAIFSRCPDCTSAYEHLEFFGPGLQLQDMGDVDTLVRPTIASLLATVGEVPVRDHNYSLSLASLREDGTLYHIPPAHYEQALQMYESSRVVALVRFPMDLFGEKSTELKSAFLMKRGMDRAWSSIMHRDDATLFLGVLSECVAQHLMSSTEVTVVNTIAKMIAQDGVPLDRNAFIVQFSLGDESKPSQPYFLLKPRFKFELYTDGERSSAYELYLEEYATVPDEKELADFMYSLIGERYSHIVSYALTMACVRALGINEKEIIPTESGHVAILDTEETREILHDAGNVLRRQTAIHRMVHKHEEEVYDRDLSGGHNPGGYRYN